MIELTIPTKLWEEHQRKNYILLEIGIEALLELLNLPGFIQIHFKSFLETTKVE